MSFRDSIEKIEESCSGYGDKILVWVHNTGWPIDKNDLDAFCDHMDAWYSICGKSYTRTDYEEACKRFDIEPMLDDAIGGYGCEYGDFGMDHYHTVPKNRLAGIKGELLQNRWRGMNEENPNIVEERRAAKETRREALRVEALRQGYPADLDGWIASVGGLDEIDEQHPINRIAVMLSDRKEEFKPYMGKLTYIGYGEDCGDDVLRNAKEWLGI